MKPLYVCTTCEKDFTRRFNAYGHNENNHSGTAEILPLFEYLAPRFCGKYQPADPISYRLKKDGRCLSMIITTVDVVTKRENLAFLQFPHYSMSSSRHAVCNTNGASDGSGSNIKKNSNNPFDHLFNYSFSQPRSDKKTIGRSSHKEADM
jgi:hypothetical protein